MRLLWIVAVIVGTGAGFGGGVLIAAHFFENAQQESVRRAVLKQLVDAKAGIETGQTLPDLRNSEKELRAALDLAWNGLNGSQKSTVGEALHAIDQTADAWDETLTGCHASVEGYVQLSGDHAPGMFYPCDNKN